VRKFNAANQPTDPDGNPTQLPARIRRMSPSRSDAGQGRHGAEHGQTCTRCGRRIRNDCGGCHATASSRPSSRTRRRPADYKIFDLTRILRSDAKANDQSGTNGTRKTRPACVSPPGVHNVEYHRDIKTHPGTQLRRLPQPEAAKPPATWFLDDEALVDGAGESDSRQGRTCAGTYRTLAKGGWRGAVAKTRYSPVTSRAQPADLKVFGKRTDGLPETPLKGTRRTQGRQAIDFSGSMCRRPSGGRHFRRPDGKKIKVRR